MNTNVKLLVDSRLIIWMVFLILLFLPHAVRAAPPIPARIGGTISVDGSPLTQYTDAGYAIEVTRLNGTTFSPSADDIDGLNGSDWFVIDIPVYDAVNQPDGATPGETAVINVYKDGRELTVISPPDGHIIVGDSGSTTRIDIGAQTPPNVIRALPWLLLLQ